MEAVTNEAQTSPETNDSIDMDFTPPGVNPAYGKSKEKSGVQKNDKNETQPEQRPKNETQPEKTAEEKKVEAALKKLKVKGREIEVDDAKYHEYAQKGAAATETWQEAARMKREAEEFIQKLKTNPREALSDPNIGIDLKKIAQDVMWDVIQEENMTPEQKEYAKQQKELEEFRKMKAEQEAQKQSDEERMVHEQLMQEYDQKLGAALTKAALPKNAGTVRRIADYMMLDIKEGISRDPGEYVELVEQDYMSDISDLLSELDGDKLIKLLGEKILKKVRASDLARLKTPTPQSGHTFVPGKGMQPVKTSKKLSGSDWEREIRREMLGR